MFLLLALLRSSLRCPSSRGTCDVLACASGDLASGGGVCVDPPASDDFNVPVRGDKSPSALELQSKLVEEASGPSTPVVYAARAPTTR